MTVLPALLPLSFLTLLSYPPKCFEVQFMIPFIKNTTYRKEKMQWRVK